MTRYGIFIIESPEGDTHGWVQDSDVEAQFGRGAVLVTGCPRTAKLFDSMADALEYYRRQSATVPLRDDGQPNRPLTAFTVMIEPVEMSPETVH